VPQIVVIGAGIGGLTAAALLAQAGCHVTVLEAHTYAGGSAGTFYHQGYRFDAGATVAGGFHENGPHSIVGRQLGIQWPVQPHEPAWVVHLPGCSAALTRDNADVLEKFPHTMRFWDEQQRLADLGWRMAAPGLPWPPGDATEMSQIMQVGLANFPAAVRALPYVFQTAAGWLRRSGLADDPVFRRFLDAQLLISAQTTSEHVNAIWGATALDLARQGVYHVAGGMGGLAEALVQKIHDLGGEVRFRQRATEVVVRDGRVSGIHVKQGRRGTQTDFVPADFVIANVTPWSLDSLLGEGSPARLRQEIVRREPGWGAFVLHLGVRANDDDGPDHHQIIADMQGPLGEGRSIFLSMSPRWDESRAPQGYHAVTVTTHTQVQRWWDLLAEDYATYKARKTAYTEMLLAGIEQALPGFRSRIAFVLPGTPVTYNYYTGRHLGMVGGFPITSLFRARGPRTGIPNLRLVGDSIFPGQSTAGVTLGAMRVARDVLRHLPAARTHSLKKVAPS
jgi:C-3',4' desaturase CrtD